MNLYKHCPKCGSDCFLVASEKSKKCGLCGYECFANASAAVAAFVFNERGDLLLCKRANEPAKGSWDLPGGFVDLGETAEEALCRELSEELHAKPTEVSYLFSQPNEYPFSEFVVHTLDLFFAVKIGDLSHLACADDVCELRFVPLDAIDLAEIGLSSIRRAIEIVRNNHLLQHK